MTYYALLFIAGFAGSFHCIGMCGGFACALGLMARRRRHIAPSRALQHGQVVDLLFPRRSGRRAGPGDLHCAGTGRTTRNASAKCIARLRAACTGRGGRRF